MNKQTEIVLDIETIPKRDYILYADYEIEKVILRKLEDKSKTDNDIFKYCSLNWEFNQIICIGIKINNGITNTFIDNNEKKILEELWKYLDNYNLNEIKFITFNGKRFDIPTINLHSSLLNINTSFILPNRRFDIYNHYDVLEVLTNFYQNQNFLTLYEYCKVFGIENKAVHIGSNIYQLYKDNKIIEIKQHCIDDIEVTKKLYDRIKNYL